MRCLVTGGAGFIGSACVDRLLADGHDVTAYDNFATGQRPFLEQAARSPRFRLVEGDVLDAPRLRSAMSGHDLVLHLAANADVRFGLEDPRRDLEQNTIGTFNVLEAMRAAGARRIGFAYTGSVYGASKLAGEGLIAAYCAGYGFQGMVFRFVSILGERYSHGHVFDFYRALRDNPGEIQVLGNGRQRKSYLYVQDCVDAILTVLREAKEPFGVYNLGTDEHCSVDDSLGWICASLGVDPRRRYTGGERGWIGDSPFVFLDTAKVRGLGWRPSLTIREAVERTVRYLQSAPWLLEARR